MTISDLTTKLIGDKRRWRAYKARTRQLPAAYRTTIKALERYLLRFGPADADTSASAFEDLASVFEQAATNGTPVREIVGDDPTEFVKAFLENYPDDFREDSWVGRERNRLNSKIEQAVAR